MLYISGLYTLCNFISSQQAFFKVFNSKHLGAEICRFIANNLYMDIIQWDYCPMYTWMIPSTLLIHFIL